MSQSCPSGFAVVLQVDEKPSNRNPSYMGIGRVASFPSDYVEEMPILDDYVFADYKSLETNLIPLYLRALELWERLRISRRSYDIIAWCTGPDDGILASVDAEKHVLGYDVAGISGDYWSIVGDMPFATWTDHFNQQLNIHGLFDTRAVAGAYLRGYQQHREVEDSVFEVGLVVQLGAERK